QTEPSDDDKELARALAEEVYVAELRAPGRLVIGFDFGIGFIDATCGGCYVRGGLSLDGFAGVQVARRVALLADVWTINHLLSTDDQERSGIAIHAIQAAAARVWIRPRAAAAWIAWMAMPERSWSSVESRWLMVQTSARSATRRATCTPAKPSRLSPPRT